jgi:hypothetical protein
VAIIAKPNFSLAYSKANEMLAISNVITGFPFCTKDLVKEQSGIRFCTYKKALDKFNLDVTAQAYINIYESMLARPLVQSLDK